ncbi:MAG: Hpt domain-containing protein [Xanthobacteraceae bacterium]|nr:Hpt domain-containing protein [Xanthobacteraceae bacterium]
MTQQPQQPQTDQNPPEKRFDDHSVIVPPHKLKSVVKQTREPGHIDMSVVAKAEAALGELKSEFGAWMKDECDRIHAARNLIHEKGVTRATADGLFMPAHDVKGGAATLGYPLAERLATSLCRLLRHAPDPSKISLGVIDHHVDAIRALVREEVHDGLNPYGLEIAESLAVMVEQFLAAEMKDGYAAIAGDAAPRIALPEKK